MRRVAENVVLRYLRAKALEITGATRPKVDAIYVLPKHFTEVTGVPLDENPRIEQVKIRAARPHHATAVGDHLSLLESELGLVDEIEYRALVRLQSGSAQPEVPRREAPTEAPKPSTGGFNIEVDRDATNTIRQKTRAGVIATFKTSFTLYRVLDGEELTRIVKQGKVVGGMYSTREERQHGASWGENRSEIIAWGNRLRGKRLGDDLFLAEADAMNKRFYHMSADATYDPDGEAFQPAKFDLTKCNTGLGCSLVDVAYREATFYRVDPTGKTERMNSAECHEYSSARQRKDIDLRAVAADLYYTGSIHDVDVVVRLHQTDDLYHRTWTVETRHEDVIVKGAKTKDIAVKKAAALLKRGQIPGQPLDLITSARRKEWAERVKWREQRRSSTP